MLRCGDTWQLIERRGVMKYERAVKLAIEAIDYEIKQLNPQANLNELLKMESGKRAAERREKLREAKEILSCQPRLEGLE